MENRHTYRLASQSLAYLFLAILALGQCCLLVSQARAGGVHHPHEASVLVGDHGESLVSVFASDSGGDCCHQDQAVVSRGVTPKAADDGVATVPVWMPPLIAAPVSLLSRAPPPSLSSGRSHALLQIYLI